MSRLTTEADKIIRTITLDGLVALHKINQDQQLKPQVISLLSDILHISESQITRSAGGVTSMDSMINSAVNQSFYRGRISVAALLNALIQKSSAELERREEMKKRK
jgi:phenylalanyl-tRNA synthetase beta subunit